MIGVICKESERRAVEEFFELFKTPWEFHRRDQTYDVVLVTTKEVPAVETRLLIVCGSKPTEMDERLTRPRSTRAGVPLLFRGTRIPLAGEVLCFEPGNAGVACSTGTNEIAGLHLTDAETPVLRLGHDLFAEVQTLLCDGQPIENATVPTLELHIGMLRQLILEAGIPLVEIASSPYGYDFSVCLTHDIDFVGIRRHVLDHTMWGFLARATVGSLASLAGESHLTRFCNRGKRRYRCRSYISGWSRIFGCCSIGF
jgi:hypothetical protein